MLSDNLCFLKKYYPNAVSDTMENIDLNCKISVEVSKSKSVVPTLIVNNGTQRNYIHSKYNPVDEAEKILEKYSQEIINSRHILFFGVGLAYHIDCFIEKYPNKMFSLYEPEPLVFSKLIHERRIKHWSTDRLKSVFVEYNASQRDSFILNLIEETKGDVFILPLPTYERIFNQSYSNFIGRFRELLKDWRDNLHVGLSFQKRWIQNSIMNFTKVLNTPNILHDVDKDIFKKRPAVIVSAGPSLSDDLEYIRLIKENNLAFVFSVGSSINSLIEHDIYPDAAFTYDPTVLNQKVFEKVVNKNIKKIPLVFASSVGFETVVNYPGELLHFITSQDTISSHFLKHKTANNVECITDSPSIAIMTFQILGKLGCNPIILAGQDLAYSENKRYANGIQYEFISNELSLKEKEESFLVDSADGGQVLTSYGFNQMRTNLEYFINQYPMVHVINTSSKGAKIEGAPYMPMKDVVNKTLKNTKVGVMEDIIFKAKNQYLRDEIVSNFVDNHSFIELEKMIKKVERIVLKLEYESKVTKNQVKLQKQFIKFISNLRNIFENESFIIFILPTMQVQFKLFVQGLNEGEFSENIYEEINTNLTKYRNFIENVKTSFHLINPIYTKVVQQLKGNIYD